MKKICTIIISFIILVSIFTAYFNISFTTYAESIDDETIFVKQSRSGKCTIASAVMMLRRRAIIDGVSDWKDITESVVDLVGWTSGGMYNSFTYRDMIVGYGNFTGGFDEKKELLISLLKLHPEGIVIYNRDYYKMHAVLATDYDEEDDVFYCSDPAGGIASGRIPLVYAWLPGTTQKERIESLDNYWYITNKTGGDIESIKSNTIISNTNCTLKKGDYNNLVMELQIALNKVMGSGLDIDGDYGKLTQSAVESFQKKYSLNADGIADTRTLELLNELFGEHTHSFQKDYEEEHPHKEYKLCSCGYFKYNGNLGTNLECETCLKENNNGNQIVFTIGDKNAIVFGEKKTNDVAPCIVNNRTMLPARFFTENLGASINWIPGGKGVVEISKTDKKVSISIGANVALVNGESIALDSPAFIQNDRVFVPVRFLAEIFGAQVVWNNDTKQVVITVI